MNQLRIIGGEWKRRIIRFESTDGLRPTPDRVRETLFNWLMWDVAGRRVLDLCAGSGALGLEALSRGAAECTLIEPHKKQALQLSKSLSELNAVGAQVINLTAQAAVNRIDGQYDLMFLDPPYSLNLWADLASIYDPKLSDHALIYVEADRALDSLGLPAHWIITKETKAGSVRAGLFKKT
ncbi:16S rRNA (guanine(966)-N(2))-methyltransferase RsmD [Aquirhabdus sp.]|uniref:16S rRNA (guanine(966)-N(2))-methyltransferase RsmD n=1 Tax=Aquirhabdus sp. TaxID=2824160 RepID=UPI00396C901E